MIYSILYMVFGTAMLYFGADWLVKSGSFLAARAGIPKLIIGLTLVAFGTSLPELIVSIVAAMEGSSSIAIGNVIGSNIANVGLVLGISSLIFPISIYFKDIKRDFYLYLIVVALFIIFILDGRLSRYEGFVLFLCIIFYLQLCLRFPKGEIPDVSKSAQSGNTIIILDFFGGIILLSFGADIFVEGAINIAGHLGVSDLVIGMSIVAFGTSLPELATSIMAAFRRENGISIGNIIGSNLFNILSVLGIASMISPLDAPKSIFSLEIPFMIGFGLVLIPVGMMKQPIRRIISFMLIMGYVIFLILLF